MRRDPCYVCETFTYDSWGAINYVRLVWTHLRTVKPVKKATQR